MDNLEKALRCEQQYSIGAVCKVCECAECEFWQTEYLNNETVMEAAIERIHQLEKSNRNWRRKVQRLRRELKEVEHEE